MGGKPKFAIVSLILPNNLSLEFFQKFYRGISSQAEAYKANVIGGNISGGSEKLIIDITVVGEIAPELLVTRANAKSGDQIYVTGTLGNGVAGLELLRNFDEKYPSKYESIVKNYLLPPARLKAGVIIANSGYATSMIDISDGLSSDLGHICQKSQVGAELILQLLPHDPLLEEISSLVSSNANKMMLHGGDCYELLFTLKQNTPESAVKSIEIDSGIAITRIGSIIELKNGLLLTGKNGNTETLKLLGWNHFDGNS